MTDARRALPSVDRLLALPEVARLVQAAPRSVVVAAARDAVAAARRNRSGPPADWASDIAERVAQRAGRSLVRTCNATGVVLHTNLGRAPLPTVALEAVAQAAGGYSNLELDLATGGRGSRLDHAGPLLAELTGAEAGLVVNNAAGALLLTLDAVARGREVIISRGELIEIGGSFRIPDILLKSGASLREVGTTNRTHLADYEAAIGERTGAVLVVHRSNFAMTGFVATPQLADVANLAAARGVPCLFDAGSGLMIDLAAHGLEGEPIIPRVARRADLVVMSGDKLLGGPQAGCVVGRASLIRELRRNPLARALRADKMTLAALEATLALYRDPARAIGEIPVLRMLTVTAEELAARARDLASRLPAGARATCEPGRSAVGGGSFPDAVLPTTLVAIDPGPIGAHALALTLRLGPVSLVTRVESGRVLLDPRTLLDEDPDLIAAAVAGSLSE